MTGALRIEHVSDPRVEPYRALRERDAVVRRTGFIVEGEFGIQRALQAGRYPLTSLLVSDKKLARAMSLLATIASDLPLYVAPQDVLDEICGFSLHRGILAYGRQPVLPTPTELLDATGKTAMVVCPIGLNDPENLGAIFRTAAAFGASAVLLDPTCCDPFYRRSIRVSVGTVLAIPSARLSTGQDIIEVLEQAHFEPIALSPIGETPLKSLVAGGRTALIVGAEGPGLPTDLMARVKTVRIPMAREIDSVNVAVAAAVAMHHLRPD